MTQAEKIKARRIKAGYSQETLAEAMDISRQAVTNWEAGQSSPSSANLRKLAALLGVEVDQLMADAPSAAGVPSKPRWTLVCMITGAVMAGVGSIAQLVIWLLSTTHVFESYVDEIVGGTVRTFHSAETSYTGYISLYHLETVVTFLWVLLAAGLLLLVFGICFRYQKYEPLI